MSENRLRELTRELGELEQRLDDLEAENERLREQNDRLRERVDELDARTDVLERVDTTDDLSGEGRSLRLLQHMQRKIQSRGYDQNQLALDRDSAEEALHHPDVDRTTIYKDMRRCVDIIGDEETCYYSASGESPRQDESVLVLSLDGGELPAEIAQRGESQ